MLDLYLKRKTVQQQTLMGIAGPCPRLPFGMYSSSSAGASWRWTPRPFVSVTHLQEVWEAEGAAGPTC